MGSAYPPSTFPSVLCSVGEKGGSRRDERWDEETEEMLSCSGVKLYQVVFTAFVCLGVGDEEEQQEEECAQSLPSIFWEPIRLLGSGPIQDQLMLVYLKETPLFNFPPSPLFHVSWGGLWNCNLRIFKRTHLFWPLVPAITLLLSDRH